MRYYRSIFFVFTLIFSFGFSKDNGFINNEIIETVSLNVGIETVQIPIPDIHMRNTNNTSREEFDLITEDFEGDHGWSTNGGSGWEVSTLDSNSPNTSLNSPNTDETFDSFNVIFSPEYQLPSLGDGETMHFGFYVKTDMPDYTQGVDDPDTPDVDESTLLADYFQVAMMDPSQIAWQTTDVNSPDGSSWWAADTDIGGYLNNWVQHLDTPSFLATSSSVVSADMFWSIEGAAGAAGAVPEWPQLDGWDQANVQVSVDGGDFMAINCSVPYDFQCGYGSAWNGYGCMPGWAGESDWQNVSCDLSSYDGSELVVRFAFMSDPCYATFDDCQGVEYPETGYQVDNIVISNDSGTVYSNSGEDDGTLIATAEVWVDQFYDYNGGCYSTSTGAEIEVDTAEDCINQGGEYRPGSFGWENYLPGMPFNDGANVFLDISEFAEKSVLFKISSRYDDNHFGGQGTGLWIDDFRIYKISGGNYATPAGLVADSGDSEVTLSWTDMNESGTDDIVYHNSIFPADGGISMTQGTGWVGERIDVFGDVVVNSVTIYSVNSSPVSTLIGAFGTFGTLFSNEPAYSQEVTLQPGENTFEVNWTFSNSFVLGHQISPEVAAGLDTTPVSTNSMVLTGSEWDTWNNYIDFEGSTLTDGEWGVSGNISYTGANVLYNLYRDGNPSPIASNLSTSSYVDTGLDNNVEYYYQVTAVYEDGTESEFSDVVYVTPFSNTVYEASYDDGLADIFWNAGSGRTTVVKFTACSGGEQLVRFKWYQEQDAGAFYIKMHADNAGSPGEELFSKVVAGGLVAGWNEYDLVDEDLTMSGDFWLGIREFSSTRAIGVDTSSDAGFSQENSTGDFLPVAGNVMIRALLDEVNCGTVQCGTGDVNIDGNVDVLDVVQVVNFIIGNSAPDDAQGCAADMNEDGNIDVLDVVQMVNMIINI